MSLSGPQRIAMREHLNMMLQAMSVNVNTKNMPLNTLRDRVEEEKIVFLRKLQELQDRK
jgi:hypothetical protein